jgi:hypothetical protein
VNEKREEESVYAEENLVLGDYLSTLIDLFVPTLEEEEWIWWPTGTKFADEWEQGALWQIALDSAFRSPLNDLPPEIMEQAITIGQEGLSILASCEVKEKALPLDLLFATLDDDILGWFQETADVATSCFELGALLSQPFPEFRDETISEELYGSSDDWIVPLVAGLVSLKLYLLGPEFRAAIAAWYEQLLTRARAHYLQGKP